MKKRKLIVLILAIGLMLLLSSCTSHFTISIPTTPSKCNLTVSSGSYSSWGYIFINGENTNQFLETFQEEIIYNVPCHQYISVSLVDTYGFPSYTKHIYTELGNNRISFNYW